jgi:TolA-binding protein
MSTGLNDNLHVNINIKWLIQIITASVLLTSFYFQVRGTLDDHGARITQMHDEIVGIQTRLEQMEKEHIEELEHDNEQLQVENKSLLERFGIKKRDD